jgi:hypothetical protein
MSKQIPLDGVQTGRISSKEGIGLKEMYHCAAVSEDTYHTTREAVVAVREGKLMTLCGHPMQGRRSWDFPHDFLRYAEATLGDNVCPECWNHPDLPLLALGDL